MTCTDLLLMRTRQEITIFTQATPDDVEALSQLAIRSKSFWGYPAEWLDEWRPQLTITPALLRELIVFVARRSGNDALGFYGLMVDAKWATLEHLWVDSCYVRQGVGSALFRHATIEARRRGSGVLQIDSDPNAEAFYVRMGAVRSTTVSAPVAGVDRRLPRLHVHLTGA